MGAVLDLINVLFSPGAVFERVRGKPRFLLPFAGLALVIVAVAFVMRPFYQAAFQAMVAQLPPERAAQMGSGGGLLSTLLVPPVFLLLHLLVGAGLMWVVTALTGTESRYKVLLSVLTYATVTYLIFSVVTSLVVYLRGVQSVAGLDDLRPALGLDLVVPGATGFLGAYLNGINPFSIWGVWLAGAGVSVTHKVSRGSGITVAAVAYLVGLAGSAGLAALQEMMLRPQ